MKLYSFLTMEDHTELYINEKSSKKKEEKRMKIQVGGDMHMI